MIIQQGPVEVVMAVSWKDYSKVPYVLRSIERNIDVVGVRIITPQPDKLPSVGDTRLPVSVYADDEIISFDRSRFLVRPHWVMQQFLKVFQDVTETDWFFAVDADVFFNRPVPLFEDGHPLFLLGLNQPTTATDPYIEFSSAMLGVGRVYGHTFVGETTLYSKTLVKQMLIDCGYGNVYDFLDRAADVIGPGCYPADAEMYGSFVWKNYPGIYRTKKINSYMGGMYDRCYTEKDILERMADVPPGTDVYTMHTWEWKGIQRDESS